MMHEIATGIFLWLVVSVICGAAVGTWMRGRE